MPYQAQLIVDRCREDERIDVINDWKMVTLFIGGNDFCGSCDFDQPDFIDVGL
jgi:phospholipase B1